MMNRSILIVGAGPAGLAAARAAARLGGSVTVLEKENLPGGMMRSAFPDSIQGMASCAAQWELSRGTVSAFERKLLPQDALLQWMQDILAEERIQLICGATVSRLKMKNAAIRRVDAATVSGKLEFFPDIVIDATGAGRVAALSGVAMQPGDIEAGLAEPACLRIWLRGVDTRAFLRQGRGEWPLEEGIFSRIQAEPVFFGDVMLTVQRREALPGDITAQEKTQVNASFDRDVRLAMQIAREKIPGLSDCVLVQHSPGYLFPEAAHPKGAHIVEREELEKGGHFADWAVSEVIREEGGSMLHFSLPYSAFVTDIKNLILCGQSLSVSHEAAALIRGLTIAMATGQAAGTAAVLSLLEGVKVRDLDPALLQDCLTQMGMAARNTKE